LEDTGTTLPGTLSTLAGYVDTEVAAILADTNELQTNQGNWTTADVSALATAAAVSALNNLSAQQVWEYATRELTSAGSGGATAQEVWEYVTRTLTAGAAPSANLADYKADVSALATAAAVSALNDLNATEVQTAAAAALTAYDPPTKAELDSAVSPLATAANLATVDTVVDTILADTAELQANQGNWVTATGFSTLDAAGVRTAVGLASANLDTQLGALPTATENADAILSRDVAEVEDTASTDSVAALILAALHSAMGGTTWTIYKTDDTSAFVVKAITTDADAEPVTGASDPA
jgi:hypothetical protein